MSWTQLSAAGGTRSSRRNSAPVHGSLFDGLQVYVVGERQPLGSQQRPAAEVAEAAATATTAFRSGYHPHACWSTSSTTSTASRAAISFPLDFSFLNAPSTQAPSPRTARGVDARLTLGEGQGATSPLSTAGSGGQQYYHSSGLTAGPVPGSARALARMIHFSNVGCDDGGVGLGGERRADMGVQYGAGAREKAMVSTPGVSEGPGEVAVGAWMKNCPTDAQKDSSNHCNDELHTNTNDSGPGEKEKAQVVGTNSRLNDEVVTRRTAEQEQDESSPVGSGLVVDDRDEASDSFVLSKEGGGTGVLTGLWYVGYSQGYPYYLHEASGHSQWEDPRPALPTNTTTSEAEQLSSEVKAQETESAVANLSALAGGCSGSDISATQGCPPEDHEAGDAQQHIKRPSASPIKPLGIAVEVDVPRFVEAAAPQRGSFGDGSALNTGGSGAPCLDVESPIPDRCLPSPSSRSEGESTQDAKSNTNSNINGDSGRSNTSRRRSSRRSRRRSSNCSGDESSSTNPDTNSNARASGRRNNDEHHHPHHRDVHRQATGARQYHRDEETSGTSIVTGKQQKNLNWMNTEDASDYSDEECKIATQNEGGRSAEGGEQVWWEDPDGEGKGNESTQGSSGAENGEERDGTRGETETQRQ